MQRPAFGLSSPFFSFLFLPVPQFLVLLIYCYYYFCINRSRTGRATCRCLSLRCFSLLSWGFCTGKKFGLRLFFVFVFGCRILPDSGRGGVSGDSPLPATCVCYFCLGHGFTL